METYKLRLEQSLVGDRKVSYHVGRWETTDVYDSANQQFISSAVMPGIDVLRPMTVGVGVESGLMVGDISITDAFTDGFYVVYYHDLNTADRSVFLWEWFQVTGGSSTAEFVKLVASQVLLQLSSYTFSIQASFG